MCNVSRLNAGQSVRLWSTGPNAGQSVRLWSTGPNAGQSVRMWSTGPNAGQSVRLWSTGPKLPAGPGNCPTDVDSDWSILQ